MDWTIVKDFAIPAASILVPSIIAVSLAAGERRAGRREREATQEANRTARTNAAVTEALDAMSDMVESAYQDDIREAARLRFNASRRIPRIHDGIAVANPEVWEWVMEELGMIGVALEDRDELGLAVQTEKIVWRGAHFGTALTEWRIGNRPSAWFEHAEHLTVEQTIRPTSA